VIHTMQRDLFTADETPTPPTAGLFADVVFDRPLDHAFTYAVGDNLRDSIAVGKRVRAPFGRGDKGTVGFVVGLGDTPPERAVKEIVAVLDEEPLLTDDLLRLTRWMADYYLCGWGQVLNAVVPAGARDKAGTRTLHFVEAVPEPELPPSPPPLTEKQTGVLQQLRELGRAIEMKQLTRLAKCGPGPIEALVVKGLARRVVKRVDQFTDTSEAGQEADEPLTLNEDQERVWSDIAPALASGGFHAFLLHGVTGSGKTEIYLRAIEEVVRQGKEALVLVPEISLTPQTIQRFKGRCGEVAVLHSHLGDTERGGHWRRVAAGKVQVVVGARSAVFAPARKLGLIVIDEEHEHTFKQEQTPRYHARDVAVMRARLENIPILLGSATPSLESWHNALRGQYKLLTLPQRVLDRPLPHVGLIDLRHAEPRRGPFRALSDELEYAMRQALKDGGQVMLLLNRRGFSTHVHCPGCGHVATCKFCDLALTYHKQRDVMLCHYCGFEQEPPRQCGACGQMAVRYQGLGTEKLQTEIEERFPGYAVRRMDSDTMRKPGSHGRVLTAFRRGLINILLGTQMIAKGLDFPNVTLVGVVNADVGLHFPDFRAAERTFQLLSQVAGRTGRGPRGGKVLVQTFTPDHPSIALAAAHDYAHFVEVELGHRRAHNYPPYHRMARLIVRSRDQEAAAAFAERMAATFTTMLAKMPANTGTEVRLLGPAEAPVFRLKGYYRYHFQLQSPSAATLHQALRAVLPTLRTPSGVEFTLDVDPFNML
jgi:primosomal protein N' (replication factor Y) (superfamily II helicase)